MTACAGAFHVRSIPVSLVCFFFFGRIASSLPSLPPSLPLRFPHVLLSTFLFVQALEEIRHDIESYMRDVSFSSMDATARRSGRSWGGGVGLGSNEKFPDPI